MDIFDDRIRLRDFICEDIENKVSWINNPENNRFLHYDIPLSVEKTQEWFFKRDTNKRLDCVIEYDGIPVGLIGLLNLDYTNFKCEFYISMGETKYKNKGIATTATRMLIKYAFEYLEMNKVYLNVDKNNSIACRLYEKVGFKCEGVFIKDMVHNGEFIDRVRYAILKEDYIL